jgi:hypothetical protein
MSEQESTDKHITSRPRINRRTVVFLACLVLSGLFWVLTSLSKEYTEVIHVPVVYTGIPDDKLVVNPLQKNLDAEVRGFGFDLIWYWLRFEELQIEVSAAPDQLRKFKRNGKLWHYCLMRERQGQIAANFNEQFQLLSVKPDTLFFRFRDRSAKRVPVKLNAQMTFEKQYGMVGMARLEPDSVTVFGLKEWLDTLDHVLTEPEKWTGLKESITTELRLQVPYNSHLMSLSDTMTVVELNVAEFTEGRVTIPVMIMGDRADRIKLFPQQVEVIYQVPLSEFDKVLADQFSASVKVSGSEPKELTRLSVELNTHPSTVRQLRVEPPQVEFIIQK